MNVGAFLAKSAVHHAARPALVRGARTVATYAEMADRCARLARGLVERLGLAPGERCGIAMSNAPEFELALFGCWYANVCAVPMNAKLHRREFEYILADSGARACFVNGALADTLAGLEREVPSLEHVVDTGDPRVWGALFDGAPLPLAECRPDDPAWLFYTSGTTGRPKGATLTHRNLVAQTMNYFCDVDTPSERDCIVHAAPLSHGSGCYALPHVARGAAQVIPESGGFDPEEIVALVNRHAGASFFFAPTMVVRLLESPHLRDLNRDHLRTVVYGGGPMYVEDTLRALDLLGPKLVQIYGQGEAPMTITGLSRERHLDTGHPRYRERLGSVGTARTDVEVRIEGADGEPLPAGETGEIAARGDVVMKGYWENPEATRETLRGGWLHTGDLGVMDEDGFVTLKDRSKDMIISGGSNVYPREVEEVLLRHPGVLEASVVGRPHPEWGEEVAAFVVAHPDGGGRAPAPEPGELDALCLEHIARFKRPRHYRFLDALPKNHYGKVLKTELRARLEAESGPEDRGGSRNGSGTAAP